MKSFQDHTIQEDAPANSVGGGNIAGIGVGSQGEPGVRKGPMARYKRKNVKGAEEIDNGVMAMIRRHFATFN